MQVLTIKARPKTIFGVILAVTGIIVLALTFISHHGIEAVDGKAAISGATEEERRNYLTSFGWEADEETQKEITVPLHFNDVYTNYNAVQQKQGFDLSPYKGKKAVLYTYKITNYPDNERVVADLIVIDGKIVGADLCDPDADSGFLTEMKKNDTEAG